MVCFLFVSFLSGLLFLVCCLLFSKWPAGGASWFSFLKWPTVLGLFSFCFFFKWPAVLGLLSFVFKWPAGGASWFVFLVFFFFSGLLEGQFSFCFLF